MLDAIAEIKDEMMMTPIVGLRERTLKILKNTQKKKKG